MLSKKGTPAEEFLCCVVRLQYDSRGRGMVREKDSKGKVPCIGIYAAGGGNNYHRGAAGEAEAHQPGHRTPAVIVHVPVNGLDAAAVHANAWMFNQVLATGVHGIMLTHADDPGAIRAFVEAVRFPIHHQGVGEDGLPEGRRGVHGVPTAARIWGVSEQEYEEKADPWPLNPNGELLLGVKEEDKYALANVDENLKVPGIGMAEWGPEDMAMSLEIVAHGEAAVQDPRMVVARSKVFAACKANHIFFLNAFTSKDVVSLIKQGVMVGPAIPETAAIGRKYTNRPPPY
jgi:4-hydroxy-2-oxoheptanedioate aldolase